jgi:zinc transporter ZupT
MVIAAALRPPNTLALSALIVIGLVLTHLFSGNLRFTSIRRSRWLSAASGVSVAYVFVHILPELNQHQTVLDRLNIGVISYLEHHVYLIALLGLIVFYGLEKMAKSSRQDRKGEVASPEVFWLHIASFSIYNALIGYLLLHREQPGIINLLLFSFAMALHFVVNDFGLREHHKYSYDRIGRWILAAAIIVGWVLGSATEIGKPALAVLFAFLAGGIVLNVLKEELPEERDSSFWAFALGAGIYTTILLAL